MAPRSRTSRIRPAALTASLWLIVCLIGSYFAMTYEFRGGAMGTTPLSWPSESHLAREPRVNTVVAFLHPRCPCSRATVAQLLRTLAAHPGSSLLVPVFVPAEPAAAGPWMESDTVRMIRAALPQAVIVADRGGTEAERFGALTSGTILVYDARGQRIFQGGITDRRGGEGDNPGLRQLARTLSGAHKLGKQDTSPVFGCPIIVQGGR